MNIYGEYITAEEYWAKFGHESLFPGLNDVIRASNSSAVCSVCDNPVWRMANTGMCFTCTTGDWDSSEDLELMPTSKKAIKREIKAIGDFLQKLKELEMSHLHVDALMNYHLDLIEKL